MAPLDITWNLSQSNDSIENLSQIECEGFPTIVDDFKI